MKRQSQVQFFCVLVVSVVLSGCFGESSEQVGQKKEAPQVTATTIAPAPQQGVLPSPATRQTTQAADVKQVTSGQLQQIKQMETQVRDMLQQVQRGQQDNTPLSQQQLQQMQQQVQQMMQQFQAEGQQVQHSGVPAQTASQAPPATQSEQQTAKQQKKPAAKEAAPAKPKQQAKPKPAVRYSTKYTYRGQPLTLAQERKWEAFLRKQRQANRAHANRRAQQQAAQAVRQSSNRIRNQLEYNSMRNSCHITNNCRVERYR